MTPVIAHTTLSIGIVLLDDAYRVGEYRHLMMRKTGLFCIGFIDAFFHELIDTFPRAADIFMQNTVPVR